MKRLFSLLLTIVLFFTVAAPSLTASAAGSAVPSKVAGLKITTANKSKLLKLTWKKNSKATGYQVFRSSTGKKGSFKKTATIKNKTSYVDKDLKSSTTYFYKVRAYSKRNGKTLFGDFAKANLSTRLTDSYIKKYINKANDIYNDWLYAYNGGGVDRSKKIVVRHNSMELEYFLIKNKNVRSMKDAEEIVGKYFDPSLLYIESTFCQPYHEQNGRVYASAPDVESTYLDFDSMKIASASDKKTTVKIKYKDLKNDSFFTDTVKMIYVKGHWRISGEFLNVA